MPSRAPRCPSILKFNGCSDSLQSEGGGRGEAGRGGEGGQKKKIRREIESAVLHFHGVTIATAAQEREGGRARERRRGALLPSQRLAAEY